MSNTEPVQVTSPKVSNSVEMYYSLNACMHVYWFQLGCVHEVDHVPYDVSYKTEADYVI